MCLPLLGGDDQLPASFAGLHQGMCVLDVVEIEHPVERNDSSALHSQATTCHWPPNEGHRRRMLDTPADGRWLRDKPLRDAVPIAGSPCGKVG